MPDLTAKFNANDQIIPRLRHNVAVAAGSRTEAPGLNAPSPKSRDEIATNMPR